MCLYVAQLSAVGRAVSPLPSPQISTTSLPFELLTVDNLLRSSEYFNMLEAFEILTTSGVVLWSKSYAPIGAHVVNGLINDVFIEEKVLNQPPTANGPSPVFKKEKYTLKWRRVKDLNLIFVVCRCLWRLPTAATDFSRPSTNRCFTLAGSTSSWITSRLFSSIFTRTN